MIRKLNLSDERKALRVLDLQRISYAVEARLIGSWGIPPFRDTVRSLRRCGETFCGYFVEGRLAGALSYKAEAAVLDIHWLVVDSDHVRKGIARSLIQHIEKSARLSSKIVVSTGARNTPLGACTGP